MKMTILLVVSTLCLGSVALAENVEPAGQETVVEAYESPAIVPLHLQDRTEATPAQMAGIWYSLKAAQDEAGRVSVLMYVARNYWLRTVQAEALVEMINDHESRADLLVALYPRLTNPERFQKLLRLLPETALRQVTLNRVGIQVTASL